MFKKLFASLLLITGLSSFNAQAVLVDLELQLLADISGSVNATEYSLQLGGYEAAFRNASVIDAIENGLIGSIAVQYIEWSSGQSIVHNWFQISDSASANAFADLLNGTIRSNTVGSNTGVGSAITFGASLFNNNGFEGTRLVMDVSGDGTANTGVDTATARDSALAGGVNAINGVTIGGSASLDAWYLANVVGGPNSFLESAATFADFTTAIRSKLIREISNQEVSAPSTLALMGLSILGLVVLRRRKV